MNKMRVDNVDSEGRVMMRTLRRVYAVVSSRLKAQHRVIGRMIEEADKIVKLARDADVVFGWVCRLMLASIELRDGSFTTEEKITEIRSSFESVLPRIETMYLRLGFVTAADVLLAMKSEKRAKRLVAYAMFSALGDAEPVLHVVRFDSVPHTLGLVVFAECVDGAWSIYYTPLLVAVPQNIPKEKNRLWIEKVQLVHATPSRTPMIYRIDSRRVPDVGHIRTFTALAMLSTDAPLNVPDPSAVASSSTSPVLYSDYDNTQLEVYRLIAKRLTKRPYPRFGRTLLSLLRTWGVVGDDVMVDRALLDVIYKADETNDRVALTPDELDELVGSAKEEYEYYAQTRGIEPSDITQLNKNITCAIGNDTNSVTKSAPVFTTDNINTLNNELDYPVIPNHLFARPAADFASIVGAGTTGKAIFTKGKKWASSFAYYTTEAKLKRSSGQLTDVLGHRTHGDDDATHKTTDQAKLAVYWALVYRMLMVQSHHAGICLASYKEWYDKAFSVTSDVYVAWTGIYDTTGALMLQSIGTVPVDSYIVTKPDRRTNELTKKRQRVWTVYRRVSRASFIKGTFERRKPKVAWVADGVHRTLVGIDEVSTEASKSTIFGPYYTEKEAVSSPFSISKTPQLAVRAHVELDDTFRIECARPPIEIDTALTFTDIWAHAPGGYGYGGWSVIGSSIVGGSGAGLATYAATAATVATVAEGTVLPSTVPVVATGLAGWTLGAAATGVGVGVLVGAAVAGGAYWLARRRAMESRRKGTLGAEAASAAIPRLDETFDLNEFFKDTSAGMCSVVLYNADHAARVVIAAMNAKE
jgi:hypothetical protein